MSRVLVFFLVIVSSFAYADTYRARVESGGDYLVYGSACDLKRRIPQHSQSNQNIELQFVGGDKYLTISSRQLASGNCSEFAAVNMPAQLQLSEGEVLKIPLQPKGASALAGTKNTNFYVKWDRPANGVIRIYGGCSWDYECGGSGNSEVTITAQ